ncbi:hypothetical protein OROHE_002054 [Orobanche hederae]
MDGSLFLKLTLNQRQRLCTYHPLGSCSMGGITPIDNSYLDKFYKSTATMDPMEKMEVAHTVAASAGDTERQLYELDGRRAGQFLTVLLLLAVYYGMLQNSYKG